MLSYLCLYLVVEKALLLKAPERGREKEGCLFNLKGQAKVKVK
jgi:hypothetical protein